MTPELLIQRFESAGRLVSYGLHPRLPEDVTNAPHETGRHALARRSHG